MNKVFDMGKNLGKFANDYAKIVQDENKRYIQGRLDQFAMDLFSTGRATMPDGEIVDLLDKPNPVMTVFAGKKQ